MSTRFELFLHLIPQFLVYLIRISHFRNLLYPDHRCPFSSISSARPLSSFPCLEYAQLMVMIAKNSFVLTEILSCMLTSFLPDSEQFCFLEAGEVSDCHNPSLLPRPLLCPHCSFLLNTFILYPDKYIYVNIPSTPLPSPLLYYFIVLEKNMPVSGASLIRTHSNNNIDIKDTAQVRRRSRSTSIIHEVLPETVIDETDQSALPNWNSNWVNQRGIYLLPTPF